MNKVNEKALRELVRWAEDYTRENNLYHSICRQASMDSGAAYVKDYLDAAERAFLRRKDDLIHRALAVISTIDIEVD